ncbi:MAG: histidine--tRNA ligase [Thermodesulfovibrionales bacterium]|nr:histidine--tRNA ligase [Thermodesulfovibrionales bacterium]
MKFNILKGFEDVIPPDVYIWQKIEEVAKKYLSLYHYEEIKLPIVESTELFSRGIGESTDIVEKEMYTFQDRAGRSLTLRPEGTASAVRSYVENQLYNKPSPQKFFYYGPMFRYERPQKGRLRQFYQIGAEAFGIDNPAIEAEMLIMLSRILKGLGLDNLTIEVNSIGCDECRPRYKNELIIYFSEKKSLLCADCNRRLETNPLRILDCKVSTCIDNKRDAPLLSNFLCDACKNHYSTLKSFLDGFQLNYTQNDNLVRGLDYYTRTTFEITTEDLGAQKAVAAGGRYDKLVEQFDGPVTPAVGFAIGVERIFALIKDKYQLDEKKSVFIAIIDESAHIKAHQIAEKLRDKDLIVSVNFGKGSLKNQIRKADRLGVNHVIILGEDEITKDIIKWKCLKTHNQGEGSINDFLRNISIEGNRQ